MGRILFFLSIALLLLGTCALFGIVAAQVSFNAFLGNVIVDSQIDGTIGSEWDDASKYSNAVINPKGTAEVWIKHDGSNLYLAVRFNVDSSNPWVAVQFASITCMSNNTDGALFGHDEYAPDGYRDIHFGGIGVITIDAVQNGVGAISVDSSNVVTVELKKPLNSGDIDGRDIAWLTGSTYTVVVMWDSNGDGSSGGSTSHNAVMTVLNSRTVFLNPEAIPEFPIEIAASFMVASLVYVIIFKRKKLKSKS